MGTRNLTVIQLDSEYKVAQYCQWDGYPSDKGIGILEILREGDINLIKENVSKLKSIPEEKLQSIQEQFNNDPDFFESYPHLSWDCGGPEILRMIEENKISECFLNLRFAKESIWCEWCYVIDFDKKTFEVYKGFNKKRLDKSDRFYSEDVSFESEYHPVKLLISFDLYNLPSDDLFMQSIEKRLDDLKSRNLKY